LSVREIFALPEALPILLLVPLVWLVLYTLDRIRALRLLRAAGPRARVLAGDLGEGQRRARRRLFAAGLLLALIAVLQPLWGEGARRIEPRGADLLVCLDVSQSMLARDLAPSRLLRARHEIRLLAEQARGDRLGLVVFAGEARLIVPLTDDTDTFVKLAEHAGPLSVQRGGTDLGAALEAAITMLKVRTGGQGTVLLLSDGEDLEQRGLSAAETCREQDITVHCVGFGSARGSKIAVEDEGGEAFLRDRSGSEVVSAMDPGILRRIAETTGGEFVDAGARSLPLLRLYKKRILPLARESVEAEERRERRNRFQWPLLAAFVLWIMELCVTDRRIR